MESLAHLLPLWFVLPIAAFSVWLAVIFFLLPFGAFCMKPLTRRPVQRSRRS